MADSRLDELRRRLEKEPGTRLFAQLAEQLRKEGELEEAIAIARAGLEKHPAYPSARLTLGRALLDSGDATAARTELEAAVQGAPENILASRLLGEALETLGELKAAMEQFRATLVMAPGDSQIEGRIKGIEEQLAKPASSPGPPADVGHQDHTKPMQALKLDGPAGAGDQGATPGSAASALSGDGVTGEEEEEEGDLPPTIRIRMPGDPVGAERAPRPPDALARETPGGEDVTPPAIAPPAAPEDAPGPPTFDEAHVVPSDRAPTLPGRKAGEYAAADELAPTVPPRALRPLDAPDAPATPGDPPPGGPSADPAPSSGEAPLVEDSRVPTVPPGLVTTPEGLGAWSLAGEKAEEEAARPEPLPGGGGVDFVTDGGARERVDRTGPPLAPEVEDIATPPVLQETPESPEATRAHLPSERAELPPPAPEAAAGSERPGYGGGEPLSSATLAELYLEQGLLERAIEVYREVLEGEPANDEARARLEELEASLRASADGVPTPPAEAGEARSAKRQALERTIERLEALLAIVQRR